MLHVERREGTASPPLVLLHGWTCDHRAMLPVADAFAGHPIVLPDLRGHGRSEGADDVSIEAQADAVLEVSPPGAVLVGHSMGAQVALAAAARAPDQVAAAVLLDPAQIVPHDKAIAYGEGLQARLAASSDHALPDMMEAFARGQLIGPVDPAALAPVLQAMRATKPAVVRAAWSSILAFDGRAALARACCPILLVTIDRPLNRPADVARLNPRVTTGQVCGSGHMLQLEAMEQVAAMMRRFLRLNALLTID